MHKYTKVYRCPDNIEHFKIRIKLTEVKNNEESDNEVWKETRTFSWQEKVYGKFERDFFRDENNCVTDLDKKYHRDVVNMTESNDVMFSYVDGDAFTLNEQPCSTSKKVSKLCQFVDNLIIAGNPAEKDYNFESSLNSFMAKPFLQYFDETMYIVADFGEYYENTWIKSEYVLVTMKYSNKAKMFSICPDFSVAEPYILQTSGDINKTYHYHMENISETMSSEALVREAEILNKISSYKRKMQMQNFLLNFILPPKNVLDVHLFLEIVCAKNFEYNNIYVQYFIDLPEPWRCKTPENLKGCTHTCVTKSSESWAYFGFPIDVHLEYNIQHLKENVIPKPPYIYFEVISKDTWNRYRTEGLTYKSLPVSQPGVYIYDLPCFRISPKNPLAKMRRFFIGDCSSYNDITWIAIPKDHQGRVINKYGVDAVGTGEVRLKLNVIQQCQAFIRDAPDLSCSNREKFLLEKLKSSHLIKSVEQVLEAFKRARKNMMKARSNV